MNRKHLVATLGCVFALVATTTAAAAPKPDPGLEINQPEVICSAPNQVTVTATVTTDTNLANLDIGVQRWENLNPQMEGWPPRFSVVETWSASFQERPVPTSHILDTNVPDTWTGHMSVEDGYYQDTSDIFVITIDAAAKAGKNTLNASAAYAANCTQNPPQLDPYTWPYDVPRYCENPPQAPQPCE